MKELGFANYLCEMIMIFNQLLQMNLIDDDNEGWL